MDWIRLIKEFDKKEWCLTCLSIVFIVVQVWMDLNLPAYMSRITLLLQTKGTGMNQLLEAGGRMLLFALGSLAASCITAVCVADLSTSLGGDLRKKIFHQVMKFSMGESDRFSTGSLITRSTNDITQVQSFVVMGLQVMIKAPITAIGAIGKISGTVWQWTEVTVIGTILIVVFVSGCVALILPKQKKAQELTDRINQITDENLDGIAVIHAYNAESVADQKFSETNQEMTDDNLFAIRTMAFLGPVVQLILNGMTLAIYWIGAILISQQGTMMQAGLFSGMLAFAQYAVQIVNAFVMLTMVFTMIPRAMVSISRIEEVIHTEPSVKDEGTVTESSEKGTVVFQNVSYCYPGEKEPTIQDLNFSVHQGETVAIIGATGSGKSTTVNLIPRFADPSEGKIVVDGTDIREYSLKALRDKIGYCPQQSVLLSGTVRSNVCYGSDAGDVDIAMKTSQADEFVGKMDGGMDAVIRQEGSNLSGGQKQRLSIARALNKSPEILILDDSFSALDYETERKLQEELKENYADTTRIIITQRIGSIKDADQILVMDQGRIVGQGTHEELMKTCPVYQQIAETQKEEAAL